MASITKGQTFATTEQVTNTKLHNLVDNATVDLTTAVAIGTTSPSSGAFKSITATALAANAFNIFQTPNSGTASAEQVPFTCDKFFNISLNGISYYIPCASATA